MSESMLVNCQGIVIILKLRNLVVCKKRFLLSILIIWIEAVFPLPLQSRLPRGYLRDELFLLRK